MGDAKAAAAATAAPAADALPAANEESGTPRGSETSGTNGVPGKAKSRMSDAGKNVLAKVRIEAAFGTLRKSATVDDAIDWNTLQKVRDLGKGSYGTVGLYRWKPGTTRVDHTGVAVPRVGEVAVKSLLPSASSSSCAISDFKAEVAILARLSHSCLVGCVGTGERPDPKTGQPLLFLAMEAVTGGDLRGLVLQAMMEPHLYRDADVVRWCHDMARGLHYLHTRSPMVIHRDLKLENIMLDAKWNAKVTDFGLVKTIMKPKANEAPAADNATYEMTGDTGSLKYMAPEVHLGHDYNESVDQYSFSIIMWELLARRTLLFMRAKKVQHYKVEYTPKLWAEDAAAGTRPEQPETWPAELRTLMAACWAATPASRPSFKAVADTLAPMLRPAEFTDPAKPNKAPDAGCCAIQ